MKKFVYLIIVNEVIIIKVIKYSTAWCMSCIVMDNVFCKLQDLYDFDYISYDYDNDRDKFAGFDENEKLPIIEFVDDNNSVLVKINGEYSKKEIEDILVNLGVELKWKKL